MASASFERISSLALTKKASRPPRCSTERSAAAVTRKRTFRCKTSEMSVTLQRFGKNLVRVLRLEWLTKLPVCTALPVNSQRRDIDFPQLYDPAVQRPSPAGPKGHWPHFFPYAIWEAMSLKPRVGKRQDRAVTKIT